MCFIDYQGWLLKRKKIDATFKEWGEKGGGGYSFRELTKTPFINCEQSEHDRGSRTRGMTRRVGSSGSRQMIQAQANRFRIDKSDEEMPRDWICIDNRIPVCTRTNNHRESCLSSLLSNFCDNLFLFLSLSLSPRICISSQYNMHQNWFFFSFFFFFIFWPFIHANGWKFHRGFRVPWDIILADFKIKKRTIYGNYDMELDV